MESWTDEQVIEAFVGINCWTRGDQRAPHKPLLLLMALAEMQRGGERWLAYEDVHAGLTELLNDFGASQGGQSPQMPFWRLRRDGVWEVPEAEEIASDLTASGDAKIGVLRRVEAKGGFPQPLFDVLSSRPDLVNEIVTMLLDRNLPSTLHEDVLDAVGMPWVAIGPRKRDPAFREAVLDVYDRRCAVCGFDGRLGPRDLAIEAAHVKWHAAGGPDAIDNGLALCTFHHKALDRGAIGITEEYEILVSEKVSGQTMVYELMFRFAWQQLREPKPGRPRPDVGYVRWHRSQVFREPVRQAV